MGSSVGVRRFRDVDALECWDGLSPWWQLAFDEAWASFQAGNFGVGAVLVDPADGSVVAVGRNRVAQVEAQPGVVSGNMTAHAEINAFAALDRFNADGLHLYTTLEPCLMCIGAAMQLRVAHVHFAAADEFYAGMDELWAHHPITADRHPPATGPLHRPLANFARLLPMAFTLRHFPGRTAEQQARARNPQLAAIIDETATGAALRDLVREPTVVDALASLWPRLND